MSKQRKKSSKARRKKVGQRLQSAGADLLMGLVTGIATNLFTDWLAKKLSRQKENKA